MTARLAACAQLSGPVASTYRWLDRVDHAEEWACAFKTAGRAWPALARFIRARHTYEVPQVTHEPLDGTADYLAWVDAQVDPDPDHGAAP